MTAVRGSSTDAGPYLRAAARFEHSVRADVRRRRWVRVHVFLIGLVTFGVLWSLSHALLLAGVEPMALRHGVALIGAYVVYLALLWWWCRWLLSRDEGSHDIGDPGFDLPSLSRGGGDGPVFRSEGGGDFGGGGAGGSFDTADGLTEAVSSASDAGSSAIGEAASTAVEAIGSADEGAVVLLPLAVVIGVAVALATVLGVAIFGLFGVEILLGVAVEIAFASAGGALALKAQREGWLSHALRRTWGPMVLVVSITVLIGLAIGHWLPQARTLPQALKLLL